MSDKCNPAGVHCLTHTQEYKDCMIMDLKSQLASERQLREAAEAKCPRCDDQKEIVDAWGDTITCGTCLGEKP